MHQLKKEFNFNIFLKEKMCFFIMGTKQQLGSNFIKTENTSVSN
jgi:hypothetical protein